MLTPTWRTRRGASLCCPFQSISGHRKKRRRRHLFAHAHPPTCARAPARAACWAGARPALAPLSAGRRSPSAAFGLLFFIRVCRATGPGRAGTLYNRYRRYKLVLSDPGSLGLLLRAEQGVVRIHGFRPGTRPGPMEQLEMDGAVSLGDSLERINGHRVAIPPPRDVDADVVREELAAATRPITLELRSHQPLHSVTMGQDAVTRTLIKCRTIDMCTEAIAQGLEPSYLRMKSRLAVSDARHHRCAPRACSVARQKRGKRRGCMCVCVCVCVCMCSVASALLSPGLPSPHVRPFRWSVLKIHRVGAWLRLHRPILTRTRCRRPRRRSRPAS